MIALLAFVDPYVLAVLPPGTVPSELTDGVTPSFVPSSVVQVRSSISLASVQTVLFPPLPAGATPAASNYYIRLLTSSPSSKSPLYMIRTPIDRAAATAQGSVIWRIYMKSWGDQIDELVAAGSYLDALSLLDTLDVAVVPDKVGKRLAPMNFALTPAGSTSRRHPIIVCSLVIQEREVRRGGRHLHRTRYQSIKGRFFVPRVHRRSALHSRERLDCFVRRPKGRDPCHVRTRTFGGGNDNGGTAEGRGWGSANSSAGRPSTGCCCFVQRLPSQPDTANRERRRHNFYR